MAIHQNHVADSSLLQDTTAASPVQRRGWLTESQRAGLVLLLPALILFIAFFVWPIIETWRYSLYDWNGTDPMTNYVGVANYQQLLQDPIFWKALGNNVLVIVWSLLTQLPLAFCLAILLNNKQLRGAGVFQMLLFVPMLLSDAVAGLLWNWLYHPVYGLANSLLKASGFRTFTWLGDENLALFCILLASTWKYFGLYTVIFVGAMKDIPNEIYESARIDGSQEWQLHRTITIPMMSATIRTCALLVIIGAIKFFDLGWVMTYGGPSHASELITTYMYSTSFQSRHWGYGSALAFTLFDIALVCAALFFFFTRSRHRTVHGNIIEL